MSRVSRVPYHQNVYDLLQIEPGESPEAAQMIVEHEFEYGPLPASVCEWFLVLSEPRLFGTGWTLDQKNTTVWIEFTGDQYPQTLAGILEDFAQIAERKSQPRAFVVWNEIEQWYLDAGDDSDDPPVWMSEQDADGEYGEGKLVADRFSDFVWEWMLIGYRDSCAPDDWEAWDIEIDPNADIFAERRHTGYAKPYDNGLWLRSPAEPFQPPVIDFLIDRFGEPERAPRAGNVTTYTFRPAGGTVRVTADEPALTGGLSAWWVHADTPDRLAEFARLLMPWGTLRETLRADTNPARDVLGRARDA